MPCPWPRSGRRSGRTRRSPATSSRNRRRASYRFEPFGTLAPDTTYRLWLEGLVDANGVPFAAMDPVEVTTVDAPAVAGVKPKDDTARVARNAAITVRFTGRMDEARTAKATHVTADGKAVKGTVRWSAGRHPAHVHAEEAPAVRREGRRACRPVRAVRRRRPDRAREEDRLPDRAAARPPTLAGIPTGAGGAASGTWAAVETYYLRLMNCTRTGGWVTSSGGVLVAGRAQRRAAVAQLGDLATAWRGRMRGSSRPATRAATSSAATRATACGRQASAATTGPRTSAAARPARRSRPCSGRTCSTSRERPYNGGHYRNLMNPAFRQVGIGVWVSGGRVRLVIDFYAG